MRTILLATALLTLGACQKAEAPAPAPEETAAAAPSGTASGSIAGTYEETGADGKTVTTVIKEDGSYTESIEGNVTESGTWSSKDGKDCFDPEGDTAPTRCFTTSEMAPDGTFTATPEKGEPITVKKVS